MKKPNPLLEAADSTRLGFGLPRLLVLRSRLLYTLERSIHKTARALFQGPWLLQRIQDGAGILTGCPSTTPLDAPSLPLDHHGPVVLVPDPHGIDARRMACRGSPESLTVEMRPVQKSRHGSQRGFATLMGPKPTSLLAAPNLCDGSDSARWKGNPRRRDR
jgi:hypothetical protein